MSTNEELGRIYEPGKLAESKEDTDVIGDVDALIRSIESSLERTVWEIRRLDAKSELESYWRLTPEGEDEDDSPIH